MDSGTESDQSFSNGDVAGEVHSSSPSESSPSKKQLTAPGARLTTSTTSTGALIGPTSFDTYFLQHSSKQRTSGTLFNDHHPPLAPVEHAAALLRAQKRPSPKPIVPPAPPYTRVVKQMRAGFSVALYGIGSKRTILTELARRAKKYANIVLADASAPAFTVRALVSTLEDNTERLEGAGVKSITKHFSGGAPEAEGSATVKRHSPRLFILLHSFDRASSAPLLSTLNALARAPGVSLAVTLDTLLAPLALSIPSARWLWHDCTSLAPFQEELAKVNPANLTVSRKGAGGAATAAAAGGVVEVMEDAADHVLASVTDKARRLFLILGNAQLENSAACSDAGAPATMLSASDAALSLTRLAMAARAAFVATSDTALRALLGEFRDHGLVVSTVVTASGSNMSNEPGAASTMPASGQAGGEVLWIPMRRERLARVIKRLEVEVGGRS